MTPRTEKMRSWGEERNARRGESWSTDEKEKRKEKGKRTRGERP